MDFCRERLYNGCLLLARGVRRVCYFLCIRARRLGYICYITGNPTYWLTTDARINPRGAGANALVELGRIGENRRLQNSEEGGGERRA